MNENRQIQESQPSPEELEISKNSESNIPFGIMMAIISASGFGAVTTFARLSYDGGGTPFGYILVRYCTGLCVGLLLCMYYRKSLRIPKDAILPTIAASLGVSALTIGYMSAVNYIPVGLAALIFYTFPLTVLAISSIQERQFPQPRKIAAFLIAFIGLTLAIGTSLDVLNWTGVAFAVTASVGCTIIFIATPKATAKIHVFTLLIWTQIIGITITLFILPFLDDFSLPSTQLGLVGLGIATLFYIIGQTTTFSAVQYAGPSRAAIIYNIEPLVAIGAAMIVLGETLNAVQMTGCGLVLGALVLASLKAGEAKLADKS